jgi:hypothetical protein
MLTLQGKTLRYALNDLGQVVSVYNKLTCPRIVSIRQPVEADLPGG